MALRSLWRNRLYSLLNLVGLAVGLAASVMILLWVQSELSFDSYHREADRIYRVTNMLDVGGDEPWVWSTSPLILGETARREVPGVKNITRTKTPGQTAIFRVGDSFFSEKKTAYVDSNWFATFDYQFILGDSKEALYNPNSVVLTETEAQKWFGSAEAALEKVVRMDSTDLVVRAIVRDNPANSSFRYEVLLPIAVSISNPKNEYSWDNFNYQLFLQLDEGVEPAKIGPQLTQLYYTHKKDSSVTASLLPLREIHFNTSFQSDDLPKGNRRTVTTLGLIGLLILIIASINYVNLTTALTSRRAKEVGMKKIMGAGQGRMFAQFLGESALLILLALILALGLIEYSLPYLNDFTDTRFVLDFGDSTLWLLLGGSVGLTVLLAGIYPSLLLSSLKPVHVLKGENVLSTRNAGFRQSLVVVQFAISLVLIVSTLVIYRQLSFSLNQNPGYQRANIFSFEMPPSLRGIQKVEARNYIKQSLGNFTGIAGVAKPTSLLFTSTAATAVV